VCSSPRADLAGHFFDDAQKTIAPARQLRPYIRSRELRSVVESVHSNIARKMKGWIKHKICHMALTRDGARAIPACTKAFLMPGLFRVNSIASVGSGRRGHQMNDGAKPDIELTSPNDRF
jgi:hypothetical protein